MGKTKSIEKTLKLIIILSSGAYVVLLFSKNYFSLVEYKILLTLIFLSNLLVLVFIKFPEKIKKIIATILISSVIYLPIFLYFRNVRDLFPKPSLIGSDWVGFANYFGYPLYFDNFFFLIIIFIPVIIYFGIGKYERKKS